GKVTFDEFISYYRQCGFGPFQLSIGPNQGASARLTEELFKHLDLNHDGKLSRAEMAAAVESLHKLDVDEDEFISAEEISPSLIGFSPFRYQKAEHARAAHFEKPGLIILQPGEPLAVLAKQLLARYAKAMKPTLGAKDVNFD